MFGAARQQHYSDGPLCTVISVIAPHHVCEGITPTPYSRLPSMSAVQTRQPEQAGGQSSDPTLSLPAPIVRLLIIFARPLAFLRICIEVLSWKAGRRVESWMVVGAWWGICLGAGHAFKWALTLSHASGCIVQAALTL